MEGHQSLYKNALLEALHYSWPYTDSVTMETDFWSYNCEIVLSPFDLKSGHLAVELPETFRRPSRQEPTAAPSTVSPAPTVDFGMLLPGRRLRHRGQSNVHKLV